MPRDPPIRQPEESSGFAMPGVQPGIAHFGAGVVSLWRLLRDRVRRRCRLLSAIRRQFGTITRRIVHRALVCDQDPIPIAVLIADRTRRRAIEQDLRRGLHELRRILGPAFPHGMTVLVQQVIPTDHQLTGCYQLDRRPDGSQLKLARLALEVDGRELRTDELLAALAEACLGLASLESATGVLVPVELGPVSPSRGHRPDPLAPHMTHDTACQRKQSA